LGCPHVHVLEAQLAGLLVGPPAPAGPHLAEQKFVEHELAVELQVAQEVEPEVEAHDGVVEAAELLLHGAVEDDRVEVVEVKLPVADGVAAERYRLEHAHAEVFGQVDAQVVHGEVLLGEQRVGKVENVAVHLRKQVLVVDAPHAGIELEKQVGRRKVRQDHGPVAVADEVLVVAELHLDGLYHVESHVAAGREKVHPVRLERLPVPFAGHGVVEAVRLRLYSGNIAWFSPTNE
jgi:hypothetical protein